jgi:succinylarginine dihydrolase
VHFTPANLASHLHRSLEPPLTARALAATFPDTRHFAHHAPLPAAPDTADEGAANHTRIAKAYGGPGVEVFVYGRGGENEKAPEKFPARQTRAASEAVARLHGLSAARTVFVQQSPDVIDAGVFHNDVIAVGNREVWLAHEKAFADPAGTRTAIERALPEGERAVFVTVADAELPLADAVSSYFFNSQLVCPPSGGMLLVCAAEVQENPRAWAAVQRLLDDPLVPIDAVRAFDLRQSMNNGGGPACLRLRVVLTDTERAAVNARSWLDAVRHAELEAWVRRHYRDRLVLDDLADPALLDESRTALDHLTQILGLGSLYDFQRN